MRAGFGVRTGGGFGLSLRSRGQGGQGQGCMGSLAPPRPSPSDLETEKGQEDFVDGQRAGQIQGQNWWEIPDFFFLKINPKRAIFEFLSIFFSYGKHQNIRKKCNMLKSEGKWHFCPFLWRCALKKGNFRCLWDLRKRGSEGGLDTPSSQHLEGGSGRTPPTTSHLGGWDPQPPTLKPKGFSSIP